MAIGRRMISKVLSFASTVLVSAGVFSIYGGMLCGLLPAILGTDPQTHTVAISRRGFGAIVAVLYCLPPSATTLVLVRKSHASYALALALGALLAFVVFWGSLIRRAYFLKF